MGQISSTALEQLLVLGSTLEGVSLLGPGDGWRALCRRVPIDAVLARSLVGRSANGKATRLVVRKMQEVISAWIGASDVLVPLSGGVDSRILLGCIARVIPSSRIHVVTFGNSAHSVEVSGARAVCRVLGLRPPVVHILLPGTYEKYALVLARESFGEVPCHHIHILSYLSDNVGRIPEKVVSGIGADAAAGYAQDEEEERSRGWDASAPAVRAFRIAQTLRFQEQLRAPVEYGQ